MDLSSKVIVVTGAGSGIGRATALRLGRDRARVVVVDRNLQSANALAEEMGGETLPFVADVSDGSSVIAMVDAVVKRFGRIDALVNNAGFGFRGSVVDTEEAEWDRLMGTNLRGVFLCSKYAIPIIKAGGGGAIVNLGSYTAAAAIADRAAYVASKGGIVALTRAMAIDHAGDGIRVNAVAPGTIASPYFDAMFAEAPDPQAMKRELEARAPMNRMGRPEEIANMIAWLCSEDASFATGAVFTVDGGSSAW